MEGARIVDPTFESRSQLQHGAVARHTEGDHLADRHRLVQKSYVVWLM